jgi:hypothetical protein
MIHFFRKIRQKTLTKNKFSKYLLYAVGEIILVVMGILIALQINNWNEARKVTAQEVVYLKSFKSDLQLSIFEIEQIVATRKTHIKYANSVLEHFNGRPVADWNLFNKQLVSIYTWQGFYLIDNTYQELKNSGNFAIISNDSIKNGMLNLDLLYKKLKHEEDHWKSTAEQTLLPGSYAAQDIDAMSKNLADQFSNKKRGALENLTNKTFGNMLTDKKQKNGFALAVFNFREMNEIFYQMNQRCRKLISQIEKELHEIE